MASTAKAAKATVPAPAPATPSREYLRFEIVDFHCKGLSKTVPARHRDESVYMYSGALAYGSIQRVMVIPEEIGQAGCPNAKLVPDWSTEQVLPWACRTEKGITLRRVYCEMEGLKCGPRALCGRLLAELKAFENQKMELLTGGELEFVMCSKTSDGSVAAVEALLRSTETVCVEDVITLQRCRLPQREQIQDLLQRKCGEEEFLRLQTEAATRRLLQELREAFDDQRDVKLLTLQNSLDLGADANAQEEESEETAEFQEGSYSLSALQLLVTNLHASEETMRQAVKALVEAKADVNCEVSETPLLSALQSRCVSGLRAVCEHGARLSSDVLDELKTISSSKVRGALEDILQPLILKDKRLRCPLWIWVQLGSVQASEALVRNASHDEEIDIDVLVGLQRCRGPTVDKEQISNLLQEHLGAEDFQRLSAAAATRRMLLELREAHTEEREPELDLILEALAQGANANAQEEDEDETDEEDAEDEEVDADGSMEEDEAQSESEDKANDEVSEEDDREDGETEPEGE